MSRNWPIVGVAAFGLLLLLGVNSAFGKPDDFSAGPELVAYYEDNGHAVEIALGCLAVVVAAGLLLLIQSWLASKLLAVGASQPGIELASRATTIAVALMLVASGLWSVAIWNNLYYDPLSGEITKTLVMLGWLVLAFGGMLAAAFMVLATTLALRRVPATPRRLVVFGFIVAPILVLSSMGPPMLALPAWMLAAVIWVRQFDRTS